MTFQLIYPQHLSTIERFSTWVQLFLMIASITALKICRILWCFYISLVYIPLLTLRLHLKNDCRRGSSLQLISSNMCLKTFLFFHEIIAGRGACMQFKRNSSPPHHVELICVFKSSYCEGDRLALSIKHSAPLCRKGEDAQDSKEAPCSAQGQAFLFLVVRIYALVYSFASLEDYAIY